MQECSQNVMPVLLLTSYHLEFNKCINLFSTYDIFGPAALLTKVS